MLASDLNNPDFVNPVNPDDLMHVEFYWKNPVDYKYFKQTGRDRLLQERVPYVKIMRPGDDKSIMDIPVREDHKARWPRQWLYFQMQEGLVDIGKNIPGWNIDSWDELNDDQRKNLKYLNFHVVEQIAGASDAQVQGLGMGGLALREKARHSLKARMDAGIKEEINRKDVEIAELRENNKRLESKFDQLLEKLNTQQVAPIATIPIEIVKPKRKYTKRMKNDSTNSSPANQ